MLGRPVRHDPLSTLKPRAKEVLAAMSESKSNLGIARTLAVSESSVEKYVTSILRKLGIPATTTDHRRVHAVLTYIGVPRLHTKEIAI